MGWTPYFLKRIKETGAKKEFSHIASLFLGVLGFIVDNDIHLDTRDNAVENRL